MSLTSFALDGAQQAKGSVDFHYDETPDMDAVSGTFTATYCDVTS